MLISIKPNQVSKLIPSVGTGSQFKNALGNPRKVLQRLIISSIGGVLNLLLFISQSSTQTENLWLLLCVIFFLYIIWGPILESSRKNSNFKKSRFFSLFNGYISDIYKSERIESSLLTEDPLIYFKRSSLNAATSDVLMLLSTFSTKSNFKIFLIYCLSALVLFLDDTSLSYLCSNCFNVVLFASDRS